MKRGENGALIGSLQDISFYRRKDIDADLVRMKGGPSKYQIYNSPSLQGTKRAMTEFGGRGRMAGYVNRMIIPIADVTDHNLNAGITSMLIPVQALDTTSVKGKRNVQLSLQPNALEGYQLSRRNPLETIIRPSITADIIRTSLEAIITIPNLAPGHNFHGIGTFPYYRIVAALGIIPDIFYKEKTGYTTNEDYTLPSVRFFGDWQQVQSPAPGLAIHLQLPTPPPNDDCTLLVAVGISFGLVRNGSIQPENGAGAGKILKLG